MKKVFKYLEPLWLGVDGKISLRAVGAGALIVDFISNLHHSIYKWELGKSFEGLSLVLGIEAGFATALLGITAFQNITSQRIESQAANPVQPPITIQQAENVVSTTTSTKAETVNTDNIETVNTNSTTVRPESPII